MSLISIVFPCEEFEHFHAGVCKIALGKKGVLMFTETKRQLLWRRSERIINKIPILNDKVYKKYR